MIAQPPIALTIASSDSGGGAGVQADLKAFARCGAHGTSVIVALTAQNTTGVSAIHQCPPEFVAEQLRAVFADLRPAAIKLGMLFSAEIVAVVAQSLREQDLTGVSIVVDPVMIASSGARLLQPEAVDALTAQIFPLARVVTPNLMEAQALTGLDTEDRPRLAEALTALGAQAAVVTGGHGEVAVDHLFDGLSHWALPVTRHPVAATHGAGCTHSAALAACLGRGDDLVTAARRAGRVAGDAVAHGLVGLGAGDGPVDVLNVRAWAPPAAE